MLETLTFGLKFNQSLEGRGSEQKPELDSMSNSDQEVTQTNIGCQFFFCQIQVLLLNIFSGCKSWKFLDRSCRNLWWNEVTWSGLVFPESLRTLKFGAHFNQSILVRNGELRTQWSKEEESFGCIPPTVKINLPTVKINLPNLFILSVRIHPKYPVSSAEVVKKTWLLDWSCYFATCWHAKHSRIRLQASIFVK